MAKRVKVWPSTGGNPIEVYELDAARLVLNGWSLTDPVEVIEAPAEIEAIAAETANDETVTDEGSTDGNNQRKRRHR